MEVGSHLTDFIQSFAAHNTKRRKETDSFRRFPYSEIMMRDKANLDLVWQLDKLDSNHNQTPHDLVKEILKDLEEAMKEFTAAEQDIIL